MTTRELFEAIDIYGWEDASRLMLAATVSQVNALIMGEKGQGKTWAGLRLFEAIDRGRRAKGQGGFESTKLDAHAADGKDLVGYPYPPDDERLREAREKEEYAEMEILLSPNSLAGTRGLMIDEATRIPHHVQGKYLNVLDFDAEVDGYELELDQVFGAANPLEYAATEPMDEALADRWHMVIPAPSYTEIPEDARHKVVEMRLMGNNFEAPDLDASKEIVGVIDEARSALKDVRTNNRNAITSYVDRMVMTINRALAGDLQSDDPDDDALTGLSSNNQFRTTAPIGLRRAGIIENNIAALYALDLALGKTGTLKECGELAFQTSLVHALHGDDPINPAAIIAAHETHGAILESREARIISDIENTDDVVDRVKKSLQYRLDRETVSNYVKEAHDELRESDSPMRQHAFSYTLLAKLERDSDLATRVSRSTLDRLVPDVKSLQDAVNDWALHQEKIHPKMTGVDTFERMLDTYTSFRGDPVGRLALALAALKLQQSGSDMDSVNPMKPGNPLTARMASKIKTAMETAYSAARSVTESLSDLSEKTVA